MATTSRKSIHPGRTVSLFALFIAALYVIIAITGSWSPKLGLDLRGGTTITLTASNSNGAGSVSPESLELARTIMSQRVDGMGVSEAEVTTSGDREIVVTVPNVQKEELQDMVGQTAQLYFRRVYARELTEAAKQAGAVESTTPQDPSVPDPDGEPAEDETAVDPAEDETAADPSDTPDESAPTVAPSADGRPMPALPTPVASPRPTAPAATLPTMDERMAYTPSETDTADFESFVCGVTQWPDVVDQPLAACDEEGYYKYLLGPALISGEEIADSQPAMPQGQVSWIVTLKFKESGAASFETVTAALAKESEPKNEFGVVLDSKVISAPRVSNAIPGGSAEISGSFTQKSATNLANVLRYGALPLAFEVASVDNVSAKLGGEQLLVGIIAGLIGLLLVILYSVVYYRGLFVVVVSSLAIAGTFAYAMIVLLGQAIGFALNLPGIAGVIVAIGVTADSFIIYFERIRDEVRDGKSLKTAIEVGWKRSRKTILAADSVSMLSSVVLFLLAMGTVKGFAFTLGLTTLIDVAIVFWFTKPMMTLLGKTKFFGEGHRFSGFEAEHMGKRSPLHSGLPKEGEA
ncbi:MAG: protein translocase subunit SecD [Propionibacteriaceae bacterium]|jgi:preprotein translocase subunit SecD|nr:protein translocase subunit SecD [Propionibacteriaceae bacterium]